jgi:hypothetical protein
MVKRRSGKAVERLYTLEEDEEDEDMMVPPPPTRSL